MSLLQIADMHCIHVHISLMAHVGIQTKYDSELTQVRYYPRVSWSINTANT